MSKDQQLLNVLAGKCDEIEQNKDVIIKESKDLNAVLASAVALVNAGGGSGLVSAFGSIKNFFQSTVKIMTEITQKCGEINQQLQKIQSTMNETRQALKS